MTTRVRITADEADAAAVRLLEHADGEHMLTPAAADKAVSQMSLDVRRVVAASSGGLAAKSWPAPVHVTDVIAALDRAETRAGYELPE